MWRARARERESRACKATVDARRGSSQGESRRLSRRAGQAGQGRAGRREAAHLFLHLVKGQRVLHVERAHAAEARAVVGHELRRLHVADVDRQLPVVDNGDLRECAPRPPRADTHHLAVEGQPLGQLALRSSHGIQRRQRHRRSHALRREAKSSWGCIGTARRRGSCFKLPFLVFGSCCKLPCSPGSWSRHLFGAVALHRRHELLPVGRDVLVRPRWLTALRLRLRLRHVVVHRAES